MIAKPVNPSEAQRQLGASCRNQKDKLPAI
jgi:hypothetical protein